jgi:hypothetical protein
MDAQVLLHHLERSYRRALSGAVAAKARYLALADDRATTQSARDLARGAWLKLDARKQKIGRRIWSLQFARASTPIARQLAGTQRLRWLSSPDLPYEAGAGQTAFRFG